jgi:hypothetical protein
MNPIRCSTTNNAMPFHFCRDALEFGRIEPGGQLVHQQEAGTGRQRPREIEHFLLRAVELAGGFVGERGKLERREDGIAIGRAVAVAAIRKRDLDILAHSQAEERPRHLESAVDAGMDQPVRRQAANGAAFEANVP